MLRNCYDFSTYNLTFYSRREFYEVVRRNSDLEIVFMEAQWRLKKFEIVKYPTKKVENLYFYISLKILIFNFFFHFFFEEKVKILYI